MARRVRRSSNSAQLRRGNRVIMYIRVSDTTGREDTLISDQVQYDQCMRLVQREGLQVVGEPITELDKTGRESSERAISKIIDRIDRKEADGVVVWKISRWGRNTMDSMLNIGELQSAGGFILSATENLDDIDTPAGRFSLTVLLAIAQMYSDEIGKTWSNIHDFRRKSGKTHNGSPRLGYINLKHIPEAERVNYSIVEGCDYVVDPVKGPWVRKAYEAYVAGQSLRTIAYMLDEAGIRSTRDKRITQKSLMATLDGGFAAGYIVDRRGEEDVFDPGKQEPLIPESLWRQYRRRRKENVHPRVKSAPYRLQGLLKCAGCGGVMLVTNRKQNSDGSYQRYFRCARINKANFSASCPAPANIDEPRAERELLQWLVSHTTGEDALNTTLARAQAVDRAERDGARIDREITKLTRRLSVLYDDKTTGEVSPEVYKLKEAELLAEMARLKASKEQAVVTAEINTLPSQTAFGALMAGWEKLPPEVLNRGLKTVVRAVVVKKHEQKWHRGTVRVVGQWEPDLQLVRPTG